MYSAQQHKELIAKYATEFLLNKAQGQILGVGTGSTVNCLIEALAPHCQQFLGALSSSEASTALLKAAGFKVFTPEEAAIENLLGKCHYYIDGADEINPAGEMIKGGGGALTREKIVAGFAKEFICIADSSKMVDVLGDFALPIEVLPAALVAVHQQLLKHFSAQFSDMQIILRQKNAQNFITDNQAYILDVHGLKINQPLELESALKNITGVIEVGIFAKNKASQLITTSVGEQNGQNILIIKQQNY